MDRYSLITLPHPLTTEGRSFTTAAFLMGETLGEFVARNAIALPRSDFAVWHNGARVPDALWTRLIPRTGDQIVISAVAHGGGGGGKVLRMVAMIALVVASIYAPYLAGLTQTVNGITTVTMAGSMLSAGVMIGGSLLINALLPPPTPMAVDLSSSAKYADVPSYAISGGRNRARPYEPMMLIFGRHKVVADLAANYYTQQSGNTQYLNQIFHFGAQLRDVTLSDYKIGDTPVSAYQDVQLAGPSDYQTGRVDLFSGNVDTIQGFELASGVVNSRTTSLGVTYIAVELAAQLFYVNDSGSMDSRTVELRIQWRPVGGAWTDIGLLQDAIYADHYWSLQQEITYTNGDGPTLTSWEQYQYGTTNYADHSAQEDVPFVLITGTNYNGEGSVNRPDVMGRWHWQKHPRALGRLWNGIAPDPLIGYSSAPGVRMTGNTQQPVHQTVEWAVAAGQYEIRIWKVTGDLSGSRESNQTAVGQILCFQPDTGDYSDQLRIAMRIKATAQLNGAVDEFSAMATVQCPVWDGTQWIVAQTSNPAWWFLYYARGRFDKSGRRLWGGGYADADIDLDAVKAWGAWCKVKGLEFNYVLAQQKNVDEVLSIIARAGRASMTKQSGKLGVVWDAADQPVVAMFGPFNIKAGTFKVNYVNSTATPDEVVLTFVDRDKDYQPNQVRVQVPGATRRFNPVTLDLDGCTSVTQAGKEANLIAASQVWHRRRTEFEVDVEGFVAHRGDVVQLSHDLTVWGYSGRFMSLLSRTETQVPVVVDGETVTKNLVTVRVSLTKVLPSDGSGIAMLRDPENNMKVVNLTTDVGDVEEIELSFYDDEFKLPGDPYYEDVPALDWAFFFDPAQTPGRRVKVVSTTPAGDMSVRYEVVDDAPEYYASENNPYDYVPPRDGSLLAGQVFAITFTEGWYNTQSKRLNLYIGWTVSSSVAVEVVVSVNNIAQSPMRTTGRTLTIPGLTDDDVVDVTVTPVGLIKGTPLAQSHTIAAVPVAPSALMGLTAVIDGPKIRLMWPASAEPDVVDYEVRNTDSGWGAIGALFVGDATQCLVDPPVAGSSGTWYARPVNAAGLYAASSASATLTVDAVPNVASIGVEFADTSLTNATITLSWPAAVAQLGTKGYRVTYDSVTQDVDATKVILPADWIGDRSFTVQTIDAAGNVSTGTVSVVAKLVPAMPTGLRAQVIDNTVLLFWTLPAATTLPVDRVHVKEGVDWDSAREIGVIKGSYSQLSELEAGRKVYWLRTVDTDGWESVPVSIVVDVSEPPDFVLRGVQVSDLTGALTMAYKASEGVYLPVDASQTWQSHFTARSWTSPQDQVGAGYPFFLQPTPTPGTYTEVFDFGTVVPSSRVTISVDAETITGTPIVSTTVSTSQDGTTWSAPTNGTEVFATDFRYVRFVVTATQAGDTALYRINAITVTLASKLKNDAGSTDALAADALGTIANFNVGFLDVSSITLSPAGTAPRSAVYDFKDAALSGTYSTVSGVATVNVTAHGLVAGQDVMLNYANQASERVRVTTATANSFTANVPGPNKSGNLQIYAQSFRVYLFDQAGARVSGIVSWAVKGN